MYAFDFRLEAIAAREYTRLPVDASACLGSRQAPCATACSVGLTIDTRNRETHHRLS